jgi:hypothetical protein
VKVDECVDLAGKLQVVIVKAKLNDTEKAILENASDLLMRIRRYPKAYGWNPEGGA